MINFCDLISLAHVPLLGIGGGLTNGQPLKSSLIILAATATAIIVHKLTQPLFRYLFDVAVKGDEIPWYKHMLQKVFNLAVTSTILNYSTKLCSPFARMFFLSNITFSIFYTLISNDFRPVSFSASPVFIATTLAYQG